jgi:spoIIIJ-associated protein
VTEKLDTAEPQTADPQTVADPSSDTSSAPAPSEDARPEVEAGSEETAAKTDEPDVDLLVQEGDVAGDYIERLLDILDYDGDIDMDVERDRAVVAVIGDRLQPLVGSGGVTLEAVQELTRLAVAQQTGVRSRLMLDIGGWRAKRREELVSTARDAVKRVQSSGDSVPLAAMTPFERKVVHDAVSEMDGVFSESEGEEPERYVVIRPDAD